ncbi:MAG: hypothetical protein AAB463_00085 [Patescibacteria group bacterium]
MKKNMLAYVIVPALGLSAIAGSGVASAHGLFGGFGSATSDEGIARQQEMFQSHATLLGISVDAVKNAWAEGTSFQELAKAQGITKEQLQAKMKAVRLEQMKAHLKALVDKGVITQAQADKRLQVMESIPQKGGRKGGMGPRF